MNNTSLFGEKIRLLRKQRGLSQEQLANLLGTSKQVISRYETNQRMPKITIAQEYAKKLDLPLAYLIDNSITELSDSSIEQSLHAQDASTNASCTMTFADDIMPIDPTTLCGIPILGQIAAGLPMYVNENIEGYTYSVANDSAKYFALRVVGDSMNKARINNNDIVVVRCQDTVDNGDIAVVLIEDESATLKRFVHKGDTVTLMPLSTNTEHKPQKYDLRQTHIIILGKAIKVEFEL